MPNVVHKCKFSLHLEIVCLLTFSTLLVTWCNNSLTFNNCTLFPHCIYVFCIYQWKNSDFCHIINWLVFITEMKSVYSAVRTGSLIEAVCASSLKGQIPDSLRVAYVKIRKNVNSFILGTVSRKSELHKKQVV
jgi:hypothetical protein